MTRPQNSVTNLDRLENIKRETNRIYPHPYYVYFCCFAPIALYQTFPGLIQSRRSSCMHNTCDLTIMPIAEYVRIKDLSKDWMKQKTFEESLFLTVVVSNTVSPSKQNIINLLNEFISLNIFVFTNHNYAN